MFVHRHALKGAKGVVRLCTRHLRNPSVAIAQQAAPFSASATLRAPVLDYNLLEQHADEMRENIAQRRSTGDVDRVLELHQQQKAMDTKVIEVQTERNALAKLIKSQGRPSPEQIAEGKHLKKLSHALAGELEGIRDALDKEAHLLPNITYPGTPKAGEDPRCFRTFGAEEHKELKDRMNEGPGPYRFRDHMEIADAADLIDFESGARVSGSKFYFLKNMAAMLELALTNWAVTECSKKGFTPVTCPDLVRNRIIRGCGFVPRGKSSQIYRIHKSDLSLAATAEIPMAGMYADCILEPDDFPLKFAGINHCFRTEAGSLGRDTHGLFRVHQFTKVEMFAITTPEHADQQFQELIDLQVQHAYIRP